LALALRLIRHRRFFTPLLAGQNCLHSSTDAKSHGAMRNKWLMTAKGRRPFILPFQVGTPYFAFELWATERYSISSNDHSVVE
jgi:hypothetical protein